MKKLKIMAIGLLCSVGSINAQAQDCGGLLVPLDELRYADAEELQMKLCSVDRFMNIFMQMMNIDEISACGKVTNLGSKVLEREHGEKPYTKEQCKEKYPSLVD